MTTCERTENGKSLGPLFDFLALLPWTLDLSVGCWILNPCYPCNQCNPWFSYLFWLRLCRAMRFVVHHSLHLTKGGELTA